MVRIGGIDFLDINLLTDESNHISKIKIAIDPADVYSDTSTTPPTVRAEWDANKVRRLMAHELGHGLGFFNHLSPETDLMGKYFSVYSPTRNDIWNLDRLYMHTSDATDMCMTKVDLTHSDFKNAKGRIYPSHSWGFLNNYSCPSTSQDKGTAKYFKLDATSSSSKPRFKTWTTAGDHVELYIHGGTDFNPYRKGGASDAQEFRNDTLVQLASDDRLTTQIYQLRVIPMCKAYSDYKVKETSTIKTLRSGYTNLKSTDCKSSVTSRGYSDFYVIDVQDTTNVTIEMNSDYVDSYLYLRLGDDEQSTFDITSNDDVRASTDNARIYTRLAPGLYTIKATSKDENDVGDYDLRIGSSP